MDCVPENDLPSARIKVYVQTMTNSFQTVRDYVTLGGRRTDSATLEGLSRLRHIWHLLMGEANGIRDEDWNKPLTGFSPMQHRLYFSYEMKPGNSDPSVKVYIPVQNYAPNDEAVTQNYEAIFRQCGWSWGKEGAYKRVVESVLYVKRAPDLLDTWKLHDSLSTDKVSFSGPVNHDRATFLHGGSSFIFTEGKGVYQSVYFDPPLEKRNEI